MAGRCRTRQTLVGLAATGMIRLTLDQDLRGQRICEPEFQPAGGTALLPDHAILEMKFRLAMPAMFKDLLEQFRLPAQPVSKYRLAVLALGCVPPEPPWFSRSPTICCISGPPRFPQPEHPGSETRGHLHRTGRRDHEPHACGRDEIQPPLHTRNTVMSEAPHRVLVVEDQRLIAADIENTLKTLGYVVVGNVSSGEEAISKSAQVRPELVLMDVRLRGEMDGIQAAEIIRDRFNVPVVYLTAYADEETILRAKKTITAVGVGFNDQLVPQVPHGPSDQRLDWLLTDKRACAFV
jgi:CheY-like chemotaxis protein